MSRVADRSEKSIVFIPNGRLGNALFRYLGCAVVNLFNPTLHYTLQMDFQEPSETFTYYNGVDQECNDVDYAATYSYETAAHKASQEATIVAFNTLGFFKHTVDCDNFSSNLYINKENGQGIYVKNSITLTDENFFHLFFTKLKYFNVKMAGYFQLGHLYLKYKPQILNYIHNHKDTHYIQTDLQEKYLMRELVDDIVLPRDKQYAIVIHIRLSDFNGRPDYIEIEHYLNLFATLNFKEQTVCIVHENSQRPADRAYIATCLAWFQERQIPLRLETNSVLVDFNIMKQAKTLICSMSTLAWAAAYLSTTLQVCYMPNYNFSQDNRRHFFFHKPIENTVLYSVKSTPAVLARIKPFIVTLPEYADRLTKLNYFNQQLSLIGLDPVIYNGVHGKDIRIYDAVSLETKIKHITWQNTTYFYDTRVRLNGAPMTRGEFGCAWSHLNLLRQLIKESSADEDYYLILEDDVELVKSADELYHLLNHIPQDADMCHLAASTFFPFEQTRQVNAYFYECEKRYFNKTTAYIVSAKGARKIIEYTKNSINVPVDDLFNMIYRLTPDFKYYVPASFYFKEREDTVSALIDINKRYL